MWDSRARQKHWTQKDWPQRQALEVGVPNIVNEPILSRDRIILDPAWLDEAIRKGSEY